ncbi:hypothetical protein CPB84DRAFT_1924377 [Gymnopilus junonius]|uniref:SET domain-containing protein n=1 Tax=Gymnopilus junonius TaxID=109634 RepID=A0A9P5NMV4_GYMJU|nr:hypothetical protein CPB84DRAFT_1924377 [Gymnopilus junonius]
MKPAQEKYVPTHPDLIVEFAPGEFSSSLKSFKAFKSGEVLAVLEGLTASRKAYTSVQCGAGPEDHIELNSDFVYINHSCEPNVAFDLSSLDRSKWHLRALKPVSPGDTLTYFYPSTEWDMDQPFSCECGAKTCLGTIKGAKYLLREELDKRGYISPWILALAEKRDSSQKLKSQ